MRRGQAAFVVTAVASVLTACQAPPAPSFGDSARGAVVIGAAQCGACHEIPGIADAHGLVGPPLARFGRRTMVAGVLPNTPDELVRWLRDPQAVTPGNAMPDTHLTERDARDAAAYLEALR